MSEAGVPIAQKPITPPMDAGEHRVTVRSHLGRIVFSVVLGIVGAWLSTKIDIPVGFLPMFLVGIGFGYGIGGKVFPNSDRYFTHAARNYRRIRRGKEPLGEDQASDVAYFDEFRKG